MSDRQQDPEVQETGEPLPGQKGAPRNPESGRKKTYPVEIRIWISKEKREVIRERMRQSGDNLSDTVRRMIDLAVYADTVFDLQRRLQLAETNIQSLKINVIHQGQALQKVIRR